MIIPTSLERRVRERANGFCEYCRLPESDQYLSFQVDHIIARQHMGKTQLSNLAVACTRCNLSKGPNIAGIDGQTKALVRLYNPRRDLWEEHFRWHGSRLIGKTPTGRVTVQILAINLPRAMAVRRELIEAGIFPSRPAKG